MRMPEPYFYFARDLKRVNAYELNKIRFTRLVGALSSFGRRFWNGKGSSGWDRLGPLKHGLLLRERVCCSDKYCNVKPDRKSYP